MCKFCFSLIPAKRYRILIKADAIIHIFNDDNDFKNSYIPCKFDKFFIINISYDLCERLSD